MRIKKFLPLLILVFGVLSCTNQQKSFSKCPNFKQQNRIQAKTKFAKVKKRPSSKKTLLSARKKRSINKPPEKLAIKEIVKDDQTFLSLVFESKRKDSKSNKIDRVAKRLYASTDNALPSSAIQDIIDFNEEDCDAILTNSGGQIDCIIKEITPDFIKYVRCNKQDGPLRSLKKTAVRMIRYADGTIERIAVEEAPTVDTNSYRPTKKKTHGLAVASFVMSILSYFVIGILLGAIAMILVIGFLANM